MQSPADRGLSRSLRTYHPGVASPAPVPRSRGSMAVQAWRSEASACPSPPAPFGEEKYMDARKGLGRPSGRGGAHDGDGEDWQEAGNRFFFSGTGRVTRGHWAAICCRGTDDTRRISTFFSAELRVKVNNTLGHASDVDWVKTQTYWSKDTLFVPSGVASFKYGGIMAMIWY